MLHAQVAVLALMLVAPDARQTSQHTCVVIHEVASGATFRSDARACQTRLSPASTFKIPHALVALETGVVTATSIEKWDGTPHPGQPAWEIDHTVGSAMRPSVLWFFQRIAPRIGAARMHSWLQRFAYGNADTSGPITQYWVNGRLRVSPEEQVRFLQKFYLGELPVSRSHMQTIADALIQRRGTIENARGIHQVDAGWRDGIVLSAKTGATTTKDQQSVSWLVGRLTVDGVAHVFAAAVWGKSGTVNNLDAARAAIRTFVERGVLLPRR